MKKILLAALCCFAWRSYAQTTIEKNSELDSAYIEQVERNQNPQLKPKVLHAEPLYIDLIRDLGARKGEKEWNLGFGLQDKRDYDEIHALVEYEWAPIDRLGLEVELPFSFYSFRSAEEGSSPSNRLESLKLAAQYTVLVDEKRNLSMALGYIHEFLLVDFEQIRKQSTFQGNVFNPFYVIAKRWGSNFHTLLYTGPSFEKDRNGSLNSTFEINSNFHYMITGTRNFIGVEINQTVEGSHLDTTLRPQMRVGIADNLMVGIVSAIPVQMKNTGLGTFIRLIYEPGTRTSH
ncbi:HAEPLYID family protein [Algoriphagus vanfongensis]|uniref:HAEPLYID family protein n=1 Tax=Algoriphagus vanfongensis TaxID=426371 RepID=UPI0004235670|nr:HAEPLYID family protein [Algoriphagus vanfongensis]